jgi:hypothetical protein
MEADPVLGEYARLLEESNTANLKALDPNATA